MVQFSCPEQAFLAQRRACPEYRWACGRAQQNENGVPQFSPVLREVGLSTERSAEPVLSEVEGTWAIRANPGPHQAWGWRDGVGENGRAAFIKKGRDAIIARIASYVSALWRVLNSLNHRQHEACKAACFLRAPSCPLWLIQDSFLTPTIAPVKLLVCPALS